MLFQNNRIGKPRFGLGLAYLLWMLLLTSLSSVAQSSPDVWEVLRSEFSIDHEVSRPEVQEQIRWLIAHPSYLQKVCRQSEPYIYHIVTEIKKKGLPGELALLPMIESAYNPFAYSVVGAAGLWQLMPRTGTDLGLKQDWWFDGRRSIRNSTDAALNYLLTLSKVFDGNWVLAIASYDAGEGSIARAIKSNKETQQSTSFWSLTIPEETRVYVPRFLALSELINNPQRYNIELPSIPYMPYFAEVNIGSQIDLNHAARLAGMTYKELIKLNPGFNRWTTTPYAPFILLIPTEKVQSFYQNLANFPQEKRVSWTQHIVQPGDSLSNIATKYHTTVNLIKQLNQLSSNKLRNNQAILIPSTKNVAVTIKAPDLKTPIERKLVGPRNHRVIHIVQTNDNFKSLEKIYGVSTMDIQYWNKLPSNRPLEVGQQLVIWKKMRQPKEYIVKVGDTLSQIAQNNQTKVHTLMTLNPELGQNSPLHPGQKLFVG